MVIDRGVRRDSLTMPSEPDCLAHNGMMAADRRELLGGGFDAQHLVDARAYSAIVLGLPHRVFFEQKTRAIVALEPLAGPWGAAPDGGGTMQWGRTAMFSVVAVAACGSDPAESDSVGEEIADDPSDAGHDAIGADVSPADTGLPDATSGCAPDPFAEASLREVIETLAQPAWEGRKFDSFGLRLAADWIAARFECLGLDPGAPLDGLADTYAQDFETDGDEIEPASDISDYVYDPDATYTFTNVIGSIPGRGALADEIIVLGAHMDHLGHSGVFDGELVVGADDDASGIAALVSIAGAMIAGPPPTDRRTIVFAAWGVEEDPFYLRGSEAFLEAIGEAGAERIVHYVNFDMIGAYRDEGAVYALGAFDEGDGWDASPAHRLLSTMAPRYRGLEVVLGERGSSSDHVTFCDHGIPYVFFWTEDDCYHQPCDVPARIDYGPMTSIVRLASELTETLASDRDLSAARAGFADAFDAAYPGQSCGSED